MCKYETLKICNQGCNKNKKLKLFYKTNTKEKSFLSYGSLAQGLRLKGVLMAQPWRDSPGLGHLDLRL